MSEQNGKTQRPVKEIKFQGIQLAFWQRYTKENKRFFSFTLQKNFYNKEDGSWDQTDSFSEYDLPALKAVIDKALDELITVKEVK